MTLHTVIVRLPDGSRAEVDVELTEQASAEGRRTIDHEPVGPYTRVSFQGTVYEKGRSTWTHAGQVSDSLPEFHPLRTLWERWHLNDMRSHCVHQPAGTAWDKAEDCPVTGYKCGSSWLVEAVPDEVVAEILALVSTPIEVRR